MEESGDLLNLNSKVVMPKKVVKAMLSMYATGVTKYDTFIKERFKSGYKSLSETIPRNSLPVFSKPGVDKPKGAGKLPGLKNDRALFSRLYIASQTREGDVDECFRHENQPIPPALSNEGLLRTGEKRDLLDCRPTNETTSNDSPKVDAKVFDGPAVVHYLQPGTCATFDDYANDVFVPYMVRRVDIVWDIYRPDSLKGTPRERRGTGTRRRVQAFTRIPGNWQSFLRNDENKQELFRFLATKCIHYQTADEKEIYSTFEDEVLGSSNSVVSSVVNACSHEEADTRMFVHVNEIAQRGHSNVMVRTVDTDVVAIAHFLDIGLQELWIAFGTGKNFRYVPIQEIVTTLGPEKYVAISYFHAFTGCVDVSFFARHGKTSAWQTWEAYPDATEVFQMLSSKPSDITDDNLAVLERFLVLL